MADNKFEHEDYYIKKQAEVVLANAMNSAWIAAYSAAIIAGKEDRAALEIASTAASEFRKWCGSWTTSPRPMMTCGSMHAPNIGRESGYEHHSL